MRKTDLIYLGDKVKTKKTFKPILADKTRFRPDNEEFDGVVVGKRGKYLLIDFKRELPFTHYLGGLLDSPTGAGVAFKDLIVTDTFTTEDKDEQAFVNMYKEINFDTANKIPGKIRVIEDTIDEFARKIDGLMRDVALLEDDTRTKDFEIKKLKQKKREVTISTSLLSKRYKKLINSPDIENVKIVHSGRDMAVLVTTKDLKYHINSPDMFDYKLGAYKILIPVNEAEQIKAINYKKHVQKFEIHHPCIQQSGLCLGAAVSAEVNRLRETGKILSLIYLLINFLKEPDYGEPYLPASSFYCAQDVTISPKNPLKWFDRSYWEKNEIWDGDRFTEDSKNVEELLESPHCPSCGSTEDKNSEEKCPQCGYKY